MSDVDRGAILSDDGTYRYLLWRNWRGEDSLLPEPIRPMLWVLANPSTADADTDDQTIRQCCAFAKREGCSGIIVVNLFAFRTPSPKVLRAEYERTNRQWIEGPHNYRHVEAQLDTVTALGGPIVCAWGDCVNGLPSSQVSLLLRDLETWCLGLTAAGNPRHPARLAHDTPLMRYSP